MGSWSFWLITVGISIMGLVLTAGGLAQVFQWMSGTEWVDSMIEARLSPEQKRATVDLARDDLALAIAAQANFHGDALSES